MTRSKEDISKLPAWARNTIYALRSDIEYWKRQLSGTTGIDCKVRYSVAFDEKLGIPEDSRIEFRIHDRETIVVSLNKNKIRVYYEGTKMKLVVAPEVSNVLNIELVERED